MTAGLYFIIFLYGVCNILVILSSLSIFGRLNFSSGVFALTSCEHRCPLSNISWHLSQRGVAVFYPHPLLPSVATSQQQQQPFPRRLHRNSPNGMSSASNLLQSWQQNSIDNKWIVSRDDIVVDLTLIASHMMTSQYLIRRGSLVPRLQSNAYALLLTFIEFIRPAATTVQRCLRLLSISIDFSN